MHSKKINFKYQLMRSAGNKIIANKTERIALDLSTAATFETSPKERALK